MKEVAFAATEVRYNRSLTPYKDKLVSKDRTRQDSRPYRTPSPGRSSLLMINNISEVMTIEVTHMEEDSANILEREENHTQKQGRF